MDSETGITILTMLQTMSREHGKTVVDVTHNSMAVIGVLGCTALLTCAFGMNDSMNILKEWQYEDINRFDTKMTLSEDATEEQIEHAIQRSDGEAIMESAIEIRVNSIKKSASVVVTDQTTLIQPTDAQRNPIVLPSDGIAITQKAAESFGLKLGDEFEWHIYGSETWTKSKMAAIYRDPSAQGLMMSRETFEKDGFTFRATSVISAQKLTECPDGVTAVLSTADIVSGWDDLTEAMMMMVYVLIMGAAILSIVVLYNLGLLSFTEMERDMATLKVMGLKTKKLRGLLLTQNIWFSVIRFILGLPCGMLLIEVITSASGDSFDFPVDDHHNGGSGVRAYLRIFHICKPSVLKENQTA